MSAEYFVYTFLPVFFGFLFGSCIGSGYLCYIMRRKTGESWMRGRSHCDSCGHTLHLLDLIPVISYLASGGRCPLLQGEDSTHLLHHGAHLRCVHGGLYLGAHEVGAEAPAQQSFAVGGISHSDCLCRRARHPRRTTGARH